MDTLEQKIDLFRHLCECIEKKSLSNRIVFNFNVIQIWDENFVHFLEIPFCSDEMELKKATISQTVAGNWHHVINTDNLIVLLNNLQSWGYSPKEIADYLTSNADESVITALKKADTKNMGDSVLIAVSLL